MLVMALVFGMTVVGCNDSDSGDDDKKGGAFVLTDIPAAYNGKYAYLMGEGSRTEIMGCQKINMTTGTVTLPKIENGRVSLPLWSLSDSGLSKYSGNDTGEVSVAIFDTATVTDDTFEPSVGRLFSSVTFSKGNATKSWNDGVDENFWEEEEEFED